MTEHVKKKEGCELPELHVVDGVDFTLDLVLHYHMGQVVAQLVESGPRRQDKQD